MTVLLKLLLRSFTENRKTALLLGSLDGAGKMDEEDFISLDAFAHTCNGISMLAALAGTEK
jgi:hypothetical protein